MSRYMLIMRVADPTAAEGISDGTTLEKADRKSVV